MKKDNHNEHKELMEENIIMKKTPKKKKKKVLVIPEQNFIPTIKLASNSNNVIVINKEKDLYGWGDNKIDRIGLKTKVGIIENFTTAVLFKSLKEASMKSIEIAMGEEHCLCLIRDQSKSTIKHKGHVYSWGLDLLGRLGYIFNPSVHIGDEEIANNEVVLYRHNPIKVDIGEMISRIACGRDFSACISCTGKLYTWGNNKYGNLGVTKEDIVFGMNTLEQVNTPIVVKGLLKQKIIQIACGDKHMIALDMKRNIYSWGNNANGQLGHGERNEEDNGNDKDGDGSSHDDENISQPKLIQRLHKQQIIMIAAGPDTSAMINSEGHLFIWGCGKYGKLGLGNEVDQFLPKRVSGSQIDYDRIFYVSLGKYHTLCISIEGRSYSFGYSYQGILGNVSKEECDTKQFKPSPEVIPALNGLKMIQIKAGINYSLAITNQGIIYGWGNNTNYILGEITVDLTSDLIFEQNDSNINIIYTPMKLPLNKAIEKTDVEVNDLIQSYFCGAGLDSIEFRNRNKLTIRKIACGSTHTLALTNSGEILAWGTGDAGQLGLGSSNTLLPIPLLINMQMEKITRIYAGSAHSMAITQTGDVYTWGEGIKGQLGYHSQREYSPRLIDSMHFENSFIIKGALGIDNSCVISHNGEVFLWGSNTNSKLGLGLKEIIVLKPTMNKYLSKITTMSLGLEHSIAIDKHGKMYCWGNNTYGQLAFGDLVDRNIPSELTTPPSLSSLKAKWRKVKCGSFQTIAMDFNHNVYICGKEQLNLAISSKHRFIIIDDIKGELKASKIACGYDNSLILNDKGDIKAIGKNSYCKCCTKPETLFIDGHPNTIQFPKEKESLVIRKIYAGYESCYAINNMDEIFAWGYPRLYVLTEQYGNLVSQTPIQLNIEWGCGHITQKDIEGGYDTKKAIASKTNLNEDFTEKMYNDLLNESMQIGSLRQLLVIIDKMNINYEEGNIIQNDTNRTLKLKEIFTSMTHQFDYSMATVQELFMEIDQLTTYRFRELKAPLQKEKYTPTSPALSSILHHLDDIEKLLSLFFIHPCSLKHLLETSSLEDQITLMNVINLIYRSISKSTHNQHDTFITFNYIALYRICIVIEYQKYQSDLSELFKYNQLTLIEIFLNRFMVDYYDNSLLIDIFTDSFDKLRLFCISKEETATQSFAKAFYSLLLETYDTNVSFQINTENFGRIEHLINVFIAEIEEKIKGMNQYVIYCMQYLVKYITASQKNRLIKKEHRKIKLQLDALIKRLLYGVIIGRNLREMIKNEQRRQVLRSRYELIDGSPLQLLFESYIEIIAELLERIASNQLLVYKKLKVTNGNVIGGRKNEISNNVNEQKIKNNSEEAIKCLNAFISNSYKKLGNVQLPHITLQFKQNLISMMGYFHLNLTPFQVTIDYSSLISLVSTLFKNRSNLPGEVNYELFNYFLPTEGQKSLNDLHSHYLSIKSLPNKILKLNLDVKFLTKPNKCITKYHKEIRLKFDHQRLSKSDAEQTICKCTNCHLILPNYFPYQNQSNEHFFMSLPQKVKRTLLMIISPIIRQEDFNKKITSLVEMERSCKKIQANLITIHNGEHCDIKTLQMMLDFIDEARTKTRNDDEAAKMIINEFQQHIKVKIKHVRKMVKIDAIIQNLGDAMGIFKDGLMKMEESMVNCKNMYKNADNSLDFPERKTKALRKKLTHKQIEFMAFTDDGMFKYNVMEYLTSFLKKEMLLVAIDLTLPSNEELILEVKGDVKNGCFDFKLKSKRTRDIIRSVFFNFKDYFLQHINSSSSTIISFPGLGKMRYKFLKQLLNGQVVLSFKPPNWIQKQLQ